jgi:hypothetical protein
MTAADIRAQGGARLCGSGRKAGELYLESGQVIGGSEIQHFLVDLPERVDPEVWGISAIGITTFQDDHGVTHVLDWVGESHYPEVADFIEEGRRMGVSRKVSHNAPVHNLTRDSRLYLMHPRAAVTNADVLTPTDLPDFACPCGQGHTAAQGCLGLAWHAVANLGTDQRQLSGGQSYRVRTPLPGTPEFGLAIFMIVPITALTVIAHSDPQVQASREARAGQSRLPVFVAEE